MAAAAISPIRVTQAPYDVVRLQPPFILLRETDPFTFTVKIPPLQVIAAIPY
jgi:hypothetical protein